LIFLPAAEFPVKLANTIITDLAKRRASAAKVFLALGYYFELNFAELGVFAPRRETSILRDDKFTPRRKGAKPQSPAKSKLRHYPRAQILTSVPHGIIVHAPQITRTWPQPLRLN
jgi:hypothetical protein